MIMKTSQTNTPVHDILPSGLHDDAITFPKYALIDEEIRRKFRLRLDDLLLPHITHGLNPLLQPLRHSSTKEQQARIVITALIEIMRKAAAATLGTRKRNKTHNQAVLLFFQFHSKQELVNGD
jgi:hypothetical protein